MLGVERGVLIELLHLGEVALAVLDEDLLEGLPRVQDGERPADLRLVAVVRLGEILEEHGLRGVGRGRAVLEQGLRRRPADAVIVRGEPLVDDELEARVVLLPGELRERVLLEERHVGAGGPLAPLGDLLGLRKQSEVLADVGDLLDGHLVALGPHAEHDEDDRAHGDHDAEDYRDGLEGSALEVSVILIVHGAPLLVSERRQVVRTARAGTITRGASPGRGQAAPNRAGAAKRETSGQCGPFGVGSPA